MVATRETRMHSPDRAQLSLHTACTRSFGSLELEEKIIYLAYSQQPDRYSSVESSFEKSVFLSFKNETKRSRASPRRVDPFRSRHPINDPLPVRVASLLNEFLQRHLTFAAMGGDTRVQLPACVRLL